MQEIEIKFLDIDIPALESQLQKLNAKFISEDMIEECIFKKQVWSKFNGRVRIRKTSKKVLLAYKETTKSTSEGNLEIEFEIKDAKKAFEFMEKIGVPNVRHQQKKRRSYELEGCMVEICHWPKIPPYVEIEAEDKTKVIAVAEKLGFDMNNVCELDAKYIYKEIYNLDIDKIKELVF